VFEAEYIGQYAAMEGANELVGAEVVGVEEGNIDIGCTVGACVLATTGICEKDELPEIKIRPPQLVELQHPSLSS